MFCPCKLMAEFMGSRKVVIILFLTKSYFLYQRNFIKTYLRLLNIKDIRENSKGALGGCHQFSFISFMFIPHKE